MTDPVVQLEPDRPDAQYGPGESFAVDVLVDGANGEAIRAIELSVLWYTAGKGEEDFAVHRFDRLTPGSDLPPEPPFRHRLMTTLPVSPLSYDGFIVKVCWCVRARVFLGQGRETVHELPFRLGSVPTPSQHDTEEEEEDN
jgi:hypothetical protein